MPTKEYLKMTKERDQEIYKDYLAGLKYKELAEKYGLSVSWIKFIVNRENNRED